MTEKLIPYRVNGEMFDVPESSREKFEKRYPDATIEMHVGDEIFDVPFAQESAFLNRYPDAVYGLKPSASTEEITTPISVDDEPEMNRKERRQARREERANDDNTSLGETFVKATGAAGTRLAKQALDLGRMGWNSSVIGGAINMLTGNSYDEKLQDEDNLMTQWSTKLGETADRLSLEADPTGGKEGYLDLIKQGRLGTVLQKAVGSGIESLPMMLAASNPITAVAYGAAMAESEYADETRENPEVAAWKRRINATGQAALELAIERLGGPFKAKGKLTKEALEKFLGEAAKEGIETIAKRIFKGLGGVLKEGGEEGLEELGTSFGNDILGTALDAVDGNADYGIRAQWEQAKAENPNLTLREFAWMKGEEYMDSFIGGAVSGMEISSATKGINKGVSLMRGETRTAVQAARENGAALDYADMYDVDALVAESTTALEGTLVDNDGNPIVDRAFIDNISADEAYALAGREDFSNEQRKAFFDYAVAKAQSDGLNEKLDNRLNEQIEGVRGRIDEATDNNGQVIVGTLDGKAVYVKGGFVTEKGTISIGEGGVNGPVVVIDSVTGEKTTVSSDKIQSPSVHEANELFSGMESVFREREANERDTARNTISPRAKLNTVIGLQNRKMLVDLGNGLIEVEVMKVDPKTGEVMIRGKKGDLGGHAITKLSSDVFYDSLYRDENGEFAFVDEIDTPTEPEDVPTDIPVAPETTAEEGPAAETPAEVTEMPDYRGETYTILQNGVPVEAEVVSQDEASDTVVYRIMGENGQPMLLSSTIGEFGRAIKAAANPAPVAPEVETEPEAETAPETPSDVEPEAPAAPIEPEAIDWDALFDSDPEAYFAELQNQFGEEALDILNEEIEAAQDELDALAKAKTKTQNERLENRKRKAALQSKINTLNGMITRLAAPTVPVAPEAASEPEPPVNGTETEVPESEAPTAPETSEAVPPIAPTPVDDPIKEAQNREKSLATQLKRIGIPHEQKQDMAFNAGKAVADFFATREEYEAYAENATDFGEYNADFERGVDASFANRQQNTGETPGNSVPLENEPKGEDNGKANEPETEDTEGRVDRIGSEPSNDEGSEESGTPSEEVGGSEADNTGQVEDKYPARTGDVTPQILKETFGMRDVASDISTNNLNSIYDFMMEMAKILGISPKSIGHGATLGAENYNSPHTHIRAQYSYRQAFDGTVKNPVLRFRNAALSSIAHEWWHSLDTALAYYETGKTHHTATNSNDSNFTGRAETLKAVKDVLKAINKSGHKDRLNIELANNPSYLKYSKQKDEMSARAFEEYILMKFAEAGIEVDTPTEFFSNRPNAEEMKVIAPAFDKLFEVLQEKEGKTPGTSVLFQIGQEVDEKIEENNTSEVARKLANEAIDMMFEQAGREVVFVTDEHAEQMRKLAGADAEFMISSDKPVFVSNAAVAVMGIKQEKATPAQWLAMIEKAGGLKAGEDKWMGLSDWLKASEKKTLTKQEVLDYITENTIQIEEVNYAEIDYFAEDNKFIDAINDEFKALRAEAEENGEWIHDAGDIAYEQMVDKYGDDFSIAFGVDLGELYVSNREAASAITGVELGVEREIEENRLNYTTDGLSNRKEIAIVVPTIKPWNEYDNIHFGDAGNGRAVAWIRFGETTDESGNRVLVIDEIQSKRHQEGREQGYDNGSWDAAVNEVAAATGLEKKYIRENPSEAAGYIQLTIKTEEGKALAQKLLDASQSRTYLIPDAPFEKNWHELAMKRMLRYAADEGYDAIAWTKGEQQAERYRLGGTVEYIDARTNRSGVKEVFIKLRNGGDYLLDVDNEGIVTSGIYKGNTLASVVGKDIADKLIAEDSRLSRVNLKVGGEGMKGFYDKMLPAFMNKYGKKWGIKVADITLPHVEEAGRVMHSVPVTDAMKESVMEGQVMFMKRPNGKVFGWTDGKKIYLTKDGLNPNTKIHEYTHLWAQAMMQKNPKGWQSVKDLLRGTPVWNEVLNDPNYSNIHADEDLVASEVLSRISGRDGSAKLERMAQQMVDEAKGSMRKLEARGLVQRIKDALNEFWNWVGTELFGIEKFDSVEQVTDRVLWDLMNATDLGELSEGQVETQIVTDPKVIAELEASPKRTGYRNVVMNDDGTFSSPMAYWLQSTKGGAKTRVETAKFELGKWEEAEEHPELVDENGHVTLVKPNKSTVEVAYDPYIHNRLDPVNLQFKDAWKREELVYVETVVPETDLESGYHAEGALLPVGVHSWSNGDLILSKYDKPVRIMPWEAVADAWVERLNGEGVHFDVVPPALRPLLVERGVEILPPHKGMGKDCFDAYDMWKENPDFDADRIAEASDEDLLLRSSESPITPEMDAEYLAAVERSDMETAQRMVLEAAKLAMPNTKVVDKKGNPAVVHHGTKGKFNTFAYSREDIGFHFGTKGTARTRIGRGKDARIMQVFLNLENPLIFDTDLGSWDADYIVKDLLKKEMMSYDDAKAILLTPNGYMRNSVSALVNLRQWMSNNGYDGIVYPNWYESDGKDSYIAFNRNQIKSADPVTYDDAGNVIPLSERFNPEKSDIRYRFVGEQGAMRIDAATKSTWMLDGLAQARRLEGKFNAKEIKRATGWERGTDGKWRYEEPDNLSIKEDKAKELYDAFVHNREIELGVRPKSEGYKIDVFRLEDVLDAPELYRAYPEFKDMRIRPKMLGGANGVYRGNVIDIHGALFKPSYKGELEDVLLHELQHAIQVKEGFIEGTDASNGWDNYINNAGEVEARNVVARKNMSYAERKLRLASETEDVAREDQIIITNGLLSTDPAYLKSDTQNSAVDYLAGEPRLRAIENAVNEEASKLGVKVTYKTREQMPNGHQNDKGYYDPKTGEVVVCTENATSIADAIQTILHEAVAHKGLRQLMGDKFNEFINRVYDSLDAETKAKVDALAESSYNGDKAVAMEEYMATLAESTDFKKNTLWDKIKSIFEDIINAILGRNDIKIGDNELRYILRASYNNMVNPRGMETMRGWAQDQMMREEYGIGMTSDEIAKLDAEYMKAVEAGDMETAQRLVLEAVKRAMPDTKIVDDKGNPLVVWRASRYGKTIDYTVFDKEKTGGRGFFFTNKQSAIKRYGGENLRAFFLNITNPDVSNDFNVIQAEEKYTPDNDGVIFAPDGIEGINYEVKAFESSQIKSADPVTYDDNGNVIPLSQRFNLSNDDIRFRTGVDPSATAREAAKAVYDKVVNDTWQEMQRQFQDAYQPVRIAIDAIQQETGNIPIEDYENYLLIQNQSSSRSRVEIDEFAERYYSPIVEQVNKIIDTIMESRGWKVNDADRRAEVYGELRQYLIAKHGLERNEYYQTHKMRNLTAAEKRKQYALAKQAYDTEVANINADTSLTDAERELKLRDAKDAYDAAILEINTREVPDIRDYSGLTSLFGLEPKKFRQAEAEARNLVDNAENMFGPELDILWERINKATDKTLRHSYESGIISRQQYNDIKDMFEFYIPLRGFEDITAEEVYSYSRFEGNRFSAAVQTAKGRTSVANDPLAYIMSMAESEITQGNKNRAKQALYNYLLNRTQTDADGNQIQNSLMQVESVWYVKSVDATGNTVMTMVAPDHASGETYEEFEARMEALAATGDAAKSKKGKIDIGMRFQKPANMGAHYVHLKVNGVDKAIYINGDPKAADAINGTYKKERNELSEAMGKWNRFLSSMFTNYSLEFTVRNYFRDMLYSHINIGVKESDPAYRKKFRQNWRHNNFGSMVRMLKAFRAGEYDGRSLTEDEAAFVEFMKNGGQTGYVILNKVETHRADLEKAIERMQNGLAKGGVKDSTVFKYTLGGIELLNEASELVTRFAAFKTSRDMGRSVVQSISDAKEVTVNFNTKGAQDGKGFMGMIAQYFGWSKYFFNASVQGVQNLKAMANANKLTFGGVVGGIVATGFLMPIITGAIAQLLGGDDEEYWNIPEYDRQNNFCIPVGHGKYAKIPLPIGFREMYAIGDMVSAMMFDKKFTKDVKSVGTDIANKIASIVLPINPLEGTANGLSIWHTLAYTAAPSSAQLLIQNLTNTDWKGAPLQKEYTYNENDPQWMKAFAGNPDWMQMLSKWCNEHINADGDYKGWDWSPEKLDNTLSNIFGGVYTLIKKTGKSISMIWNEENRNMHNAPVVGVFLGSGIDSDDRFVTDAYYEMMDYYDSQIGYIKRRAARFGYDLDEVFNKEKGKHHPKMNEIYSNKNFDFMQEWYKGNNKLKKLNNKIKNLEKKIEGKENPTQSDLNELARLKDQFAVERREFVDDMLELD